MARWRLIGKHYINAIQDGEPTKWVREETSRETGRTKRQEYIVPLYLDPKDPTMNTPRGSGECIVCWEGKGHRTDIVFMGPPTADMEPLDDEAETASEAERHNWIHPIETLPGQGFSESLLAILEEQLQAVIRDKLVESPKNVVVSGIDPTIFAKMQEQLAFLMARNAELEEQVAVEPIIDNEPGPASDRRL